MNERDLFIRALQHQGPNRQTFLDEACRDDPTLRQGVQALLDAHDQAGSFLETPVVAGAAEKLIANGGAGDTQAEEPGSGDPPSLDFLSPSDHPASLGRIRHYEILEVVGRGGMGIVLKALDQTLHRVAAIKVMAPHLATSATARKRFVREAQATAAVRNDHVIAIYAVDDANDPPFLVMEYVHGVSLHERLDRSGPLQLPEILRIGMQVAAGLAAAHAQGLIHRDVKPANILLENGVERVKITDFGLARAVDDASLTQSGVVAGTPQYMAPEQARGESVDHRADLFSLGSVLYAMCTGRAPFRASGSMAVLRRVCDEPARPVRDINSNIPDWLATIIEKLHAKNPPDRFQTAAEVAELLGKHLAHLQQPALVPMPTLPPSPHRGSALGHRGGSEGTRVRMRYWPMAAAILVLLVGSLGLTEATGVTHLAATVIRILTPDGTLVVEVDDPDIKVTVDADGGLVITGAGPHEIRLHPGSYRLQATKDGKPIKNEIVSISRGDRRVVQVRLEPNGQGRALALFVFTPPPPGLLDKLDPAKIPASERFPWLPKEVVAVLGEHRGRQWGESATSVAFSPDGKQAASSGYMRQIYVWDAETLNLRAVLIGHTRTTWGVAFSPDGRRLLSCGEDETVRLWDLDKGRELRQFVGHKGTVWSVAYSPDGHHVLSSGDDHTVRLWDAETGNLVHSFEGHTDKVNSVAFSPDGTHVLSGSRDKTMRLWSLKTGQEVRRFGGHTGSFRIVFLPDGRRALSGSEDKTVRLWDVQTGEELRRFEGHTDAVFYVAISADGRQALSCSADRTIRLWDVETGEQLRLMQLPDKRLAANSVAFSLDGRRALSSSGAGNLHLLDLETGKELNPPVGVLPRGSVVKVAFSPDSSRLLVAWGDPFMRLLEVPSGRELRRFELPADVVRTVAYSANGRSVLGAGGGGMAGWDADSGQELHRFAETHAIWDVALARDGRHIVTGGLDRTVRWWDVDSGRQLNCFRGHPGQVHSVALAPDGHSAVSGCEEGVVRLWDLEAGRERHQLRTRGAAVRAVAYSPDGRHIASGDYDGFVRIWDVTGTEPKMRSLLKWHSCNVPGLVFAPDAQTLVSVDGSGLIILWDVAAGAKRREWQLPGSVHGITFAPDGRHLATANGNGTIYILRLKEVGQ